MSDFLTKQIEARQRAWMGMGGLRKGGSQMFSQLKFVDWTRFLWSWQSRAGGVAAEGGGGRGDWVRVQVLARGGVGR